MTTLLLAQNRPQAVSEVVEKAAVAISRRQGDWGVDGAWSYDFSKLGYACAATSHSGAKPELGIDGDFGTHDVHRDSHNSSCASKRSDVLKDSVDRVLHRSQGGGEALRVLDLGAGSGGWLLQARRELEKNKTRGESPTIHLHGVTGDALPSEVRAMKPSKVKKRDSVEVGHFQQVSIEMFPLRLGSDSHCGSEEQRIQLAWMVDTVLAAGDLKCERSGEKRGYDLIVSSWTFCHLIDPLATLELWSNALAVEGELYANDIDFSVLFAGEGTFTDLTTSHGREDSTEVARPREQHRESGDNRCVFWERDPERRMEHAFEVLNRKGEDDRAFSIQFVYDDKDYRTAVKVTRISAAPVRFAPAVGYSCPDDERGEDPLFDGGGRPVYRVSHKLTEEPASLEPSSS